MLVTGYTPEWSVGEGQPCAVHVACASPEVYLHIRRHLGSISKPGDWAMNTKVVEPIKKFSCKKTDFKIDRGSRFQVRLGQETDLGCRLNFDLQLPDHPSAAGAVASIGDAQSECTLSVTEDFRLLLALNEYGKTVQSVTTQSGLQPLRWYSLELIIGETDAQLSVLDSTPPQCVKLEVALQASRQLVIGSMPASLGSHCRVGQPTLHDKNGNVLARWNLARSDTHPMVVPDGCTGCLNGRLEGAPKRSMPNRLWTGDNPSPKLDSAHFNAFDVSNDDLEDAHWPCLTMLTAPGESGVYSIVLSPYREIDWTDRVSFDALPLFVVPGARQKSKIAFVIPTFSYRAYANNTFCEPEDPEQFPFSGPNECEPLYSAADAMGLKSLYGLHADGSGVSLASLKRPQMTIRADFRSQLLGVTHQFAADLSILGWLHRSGVEFDVLTDEALDEATDDLLAHYDVLITGSHPEYCSRSSLAAYDTHRLQGGSILYAGGNGFYWRVCRVLEVPHLIEVVRTQGVRTWSAASGESHHTLDQTPGGLCRNFSPSSEDLFGSSFSAMGFSGEGAYQADCHLGLSELPKNLSDFFRQVGDSPFGVAGLELDGTHADGFHKGNRYVLARAIDLPAGYVPAIEDVASLDVFATRPAEKLSELAQGQIILVEHETGGLGLSIGSIRWADGLNDSGDERRCAELMMAGLKDMLHRPKQRPVVSTAKGGEN